MANCCHTENTGSGERGRPEKPGRSIMITFRLREGEHDPILDRLLRLPHRNRSAYIRRVLSGAPVDLLDDAFEQESATLSAALDDAWEDDNE